jgi:hypothetical protein
MAARAAGDVVRANLQVPRPVVAVGHGPQLRRRRDRPGRGMA